MKKNANMYEEQNQAEQDAIEREAYRDLTREEDIINGITHDVHEPTTYELAEAELKYQERMHKYLFDAMRGN